MPAGFRRHLVGKTLRNVFHCDSAEICFVGKRSVLLPSVLWRCWLGGRKGTRPVKNWVVGCWCLVVWLSVCSEVQTCICPSWCHCHSLSLASVKSRLVLPFWYRPTWVVPEKWPSNGCVGVCGRLMINYEPFKRCRKLWDIKNPTYKL